MATCTATTVAALLFLAPVALAGDRVPGEHWERYADPAQVGFDADTLSALREQWEALDSSAFLIVHDGAIVASWGEVDRRFMCHSVRKSFLSALYGVYHDRGAIELEQTLGELGIDDIGDGLTELEKTARISDLLKARSGVYRLAAYEPPENPKPERGAHAPGRYWCYNNWDFNTLSTIFVQVTGEDVFEAFDAAFGQPLGMQDWRVRDGYYHFEHEKSEHPAYPFRLSARDAARFGLLFEREGLWGDERLLSASWVRRSSFPFSKERRFGGYGLMWWIFDGHADLAEAGMYAALGVGNQMIAVLPERDLVIVNRANTYEGESTSGPRLLALVKAIVASQGERRDAEPALEPLGAAASEHDFVRDPEVLRAYVGEFPYPAPSIGEPETETLVELESDRLLVTTSDAGTFEFLLAPDGSFTAEDSHYRFVAVFDDDGAFTGFADGYSLVQAAFAAELSEDGDAAQADHFWGLLTPLDDDPGVSAMLAAHDLARDRDDEARARLALWSADERALAEAVAPALGGAERRYREGGREDVADRILALVAELTGSDD